MIDISSYACFGNVIMCIATKDQSYLAVSHLVTDVNEDQLAVAEVNCAKAQGPFQLLSFGWLPYPLIHYYHSNGVQVRLCS